MSYTVTARRAKKAFLALFMATIIENHKQCVIGGIHAVRGRYVGRVCYSNMKEARSFMRRDGSELQRLKRRFGPQNRSSRRREGIRHGLEWIENEANRLR